MRDRFSEAYLAACVIGLALCGAWGLDQHTKKIRALEVRIELLELGTPLVPQVDPYAMPPLIFEVPEEPIAEGVVEI